MQPPSSPKQHSLDLGVEVQRDVNGVEMGVLENGMPFLTQGGLSRITGTDVRTIRDITRDWADSFEDQVLGKDRLSFFKEYLFRHGYGEPRLYLEVQRSGQTHYAYPDIVCMAFLEYYAFEAKNKNQEAVENYRRFATYGLRRFIYDSLEYTPLDKWKYHNDRVSILQNSAPPGYFTVFGEITGLIVDLINADLTVNEKTIPDISVGQAWAKNWKEAGLEEQFGVRVPYKHNYPDYYPQSMSNPQDANAYPDEALPEFRRWFKQEYLPTKFPKYILNKANVIPGGKEEVLRLANLFSPKELPRK